MGWFIVVLQFICLALQIIYFLKWKKLFDSDNFSAARKANSLSNFWMFGVFAFMVIGWFLA